MDDHPAADQLGSSDSRIPTAHRHTCCYAAVVWESIWDIGVYRVAMYANLDVDDMGQGRS